MRFSFTEDQVALRLAVRQVLEAECPVSSLRALAEAPTDPATVAASAARWAVLAELGALGLVAPEADGGLGLGPVELVGVLEEAGWAALPEPLAETAGLAVPLLAGSGHVGSVAGGAVTATVGGLEVAAPLVEGRGRIGCTTGPSSGPGPGALCTPRVNGAPGAGLLVLFAEVDGELQCHAVPAGAATLRPLAALDPTRQLGDVVWTPTAETCLATTSDAAAMATATVERAAVAMAAQLLGLSDRMITMAAEYAKARQQFGRPIGSFQAVKHLLADARVALEFARPVTYRAAWSLARADEDPLTAVHDASMAKALASDAADLAARVALQVHGAIGYTWECDLHLFMKRAWALSAAWGDAGTHRARVLALAQGRRRLSATGEESA